MKFLVLLALVASARAFTYTTGSAHPAYHHLGYAGHYAAYSPFAGYRSYVHPTANFGYSHSTVHHAAPVATKVVSHVAPVLKTAAVVAPAVAHVAPTYYTHASYAPTTQYRSQNELGEYQFGYTADHSARDEVRTADGVVQGQYSYVDANNVHQKVNYVADALGFRVAGTNVHPTAAVAPVAHVATAPVAHHTVEHVAHPGAIVKTAVVENPVHHVVKTVVDEVNPHVAYTPEVAAARANHLAALSDATVAHAALPAAHVATHVIAKRAAVYGHGRRYSGHGHRSYGSHGHGRRSYGSYPRRSYGSYRRY